MIQEINIREDNNDKEVFVNMPKEEMSKMSDMMSDKTVLAAIVISSVSFFIIFVVGIIIFLNRDSSNQSDIYSAYSEASSSTYLKSPRKELPYNYFVGEDGRINQTLNDDNQHSINSAKHNLER